MAAVQLAEQTESHPATALAPEEEHVARLLLSRFVGEMRGKRTYCYSVGQLAAALAEQRMPVVPSGSLALKRLELKPSELDQLWRSVKATSRVLPDEILEQFLPRPFWPSLIWMVDAGPVDASERVEAILEAWIAGVNEDGTPRMVRRIRSDEQCDAIPAKPLSEGTVDVILTGVNQLFSHLVELRRLSESGKFDQLPRSLGNWKRDSLPKPKKAADLEAQPANRDRSAPPLLAIRRLLKGLDREVRARSTTERGRLHSFKFLRDRAFIGAMVVIGGRRGSFGDLRRGDFIASHVFPDGSIGPALVLTLGEGVKGRGLRRVKGIPQLLGDWIEE